MCSKPVNKLTGHQDQGPSWLMVTCPCKRNSALIPRIDVASMIFLVIPEGRSKDVVLGSGDCPASRPAIRIISRGFEVLLVRRIASISGIDRRLPGHKPSIKDDAMRWPRECDSRFFARTSDLRFLMTFLPSTFPSWKITHTSREDNNSNAVQPREYQGESRIAKQGDPSSAHGKLIRYSSCTRVHLAF